MTSCSLDIRIGVNGSEKKDLYKHIDLTVELHQQKVAKTSQEMAALLGKTAVPFIVIEYSDAALENSQIFNFKAHDYESSFAKVAGGKVYQYCNPRNKGTIKLLKNIQKEFQKITKLNNQCTLKLSLYDSLRQQQPQNKLLLLNHSKIKGNIQGDPELVPSLMQIIRRISNQFLNSPFMAFLELLQTITIKLNLSPVQQFSQELKESYLSLLDFSSWASKQKLHQLQKAKGDIVINITLPKLVIVRIKAEASVLAAFLSIF